MSRQIDEVKRHGRHYTPPALARFLADRTCASFEVQEGKVRVLDPACGDGELLLAAAAGLSARGFDDVELVGFDLDDEAVAIAADRLASAGLNSRVTAGDFLDLADHATLHPFDILITNPPYVRTQALGQGASQRLALEYGLQGRVDLTHAFVALAPRLLTSGGVLGLLCSNRFLSTKAGVNVRDVLTRNLHVRELFDLGDTKLFSAAVLPAIVIATTRRPTEPGVPYVRAYQSPEVERPGLPGLFDVLHAGVGADAVSAGKVIRVEVGELEVGGSSASPWRLTSKTHNKRFSAIESATWKTFGQMAKIRVGIKTTADAVFIRSDWERLTDIPAPEDDLLLPLLTHDNLTAWRPPSDPSSRVVYPYDLTRERRTLLDLEDYPKTRSYFTHHEARLRSRKYVTDGGREWYEIWVPQRPGLWSSPKIVFPDISELPRFALDRSGAVVNGDCYWISVPEVGDEDVAYLMIGVANSALAVEFYDHVCGNRLYSGRRRWITQYVNLLPVPYPDSEASREVIEISRKLCQQAVSDESELIEQLNVAVERAFERVSDAPSDVLF